MDRPIVATVSGGSVRPIVITYDIPAWRNDVDRYDEAELAIRRANFRGRLSEEHIQTMMTWLRDNEVSDDEAARLRTARRRPTSQFAAELQRLAKDAAPIWREVGKVIDEAEERIAGGEVGRLYARAFEAVTLGIPGWENWTPEHKQKVFDLLRKSIEDGDDGAASVPVA